MGCGSSKSNKSKSEGKKQYRLKMDPETTTTDLVDRGEPEEEEKALDNKAHRGFDNGFKDTGVKDSINNMSFNDQQDAKATNLKALRN